jgi:hypothetical protein
MVRLEKRKVPAILAGPVTFGAMLTRTSTAMLLGSAWLVGING